MKAKLEFGFTLFKWMAMVTFLTILNSSSPLYGQGTAFIYQGRLDDGGSPAQGAYDFRFRLAADALANNYVGGSLLTNGIPVTNGLFTVSLDFGAGIFNGSNYWLEIAVRTNLAPGYTTLSPLQNLTPAPYAVFAGSVSAAGLSGIFSGPVTLSNSGNSFTGTFNGNGTNLTNVNAITLGGVAANQLWATAGNSNTVPGTNFLGTSDNQPFELHVNGIRALRIEPNTNQAPNVIGGAPVNYVDPGIVGATIAGGGTVSGNFYLGNGSNHVAAIFGTIAGGRMNTIGADHGFIGGGISNTTQQFAYDAVIGGGVGNTIGTNAYDSVIVGGFFNAIGQNLEYSAIGGGLQNKIGDQSYYATISGGVFNLILTNASASVIAGGENNTISNNLFVATISGGNANSIQTASSYSTIGGGYGNTISNNTTSATISGGNRNNIQTNAAYSTISGGFNNAILTNAQYGSISGGFFNTVGGNYAAVPGGYNNQALGANSFAAGELAQALHQGSFVWADSQGSAFNSTSNNQFNVRAGGGVRFVTGGAGMTVDGLPVPTSNAALRIGGNIFSGQQTFNNTVGIGTPFPLAFLHVEAPDAGQLILQNSANGEYWLLYSESFNNSGNLILQPNTGIGGYISRVDGNYHINSDARLKRDIAPLEGVLGRVLQLRPVSYHFRSAPEDSPLTLGLIAQEVEPLFPEVVGERNGIKSLAYSELVPVTISAIQELNQKLENQKGELKEKETEITDLKQRLEALEKIVRAQPQVRQ